MHEHTPPSTPQDTEADTAVEEITEPVLQLARTFSLTRTFSALSTNINPFLAQDSRLDPKSPEFQPESWVKALLHAFSKDPSKHPRYTAGVSWRNLSVHGFSDPTEFQKDVFNIIWRSPLAALDWFAKRKQKVKIISDFDGLVKSGELLLVLGRPGSGVSTLLKTIAGHTHGLHLDDASEFNYQGIPWGLMHRNFRGEVIYQAETDIHFPQLTVGDTLLFAALARTPQHIVANISRHVYAEHMRDAVMAMFGISNTLNTKVGDDFVRGVSGGERKRVSIAEAILNQSAIQCWDNSTRGLDSATALEFVRKLRLGTKLGGASAVVAMYQAIPPGHLLIPTTNYSQEFDKVLLLYEGRQIFFGPTSEATRYFTTMGFECPPRQTTADFLTSLTSPDERIVRPGFENKVPRSPDEFADEWRMSQHRAWLLSDIAAFEIQYPLDGKQVETLKGIRRAQKAKFTSDKSPFTISIPMQIQLCIGRGVKRLLGDKTFFVVTIAVNFVMSLVLGSVYFNLPSTAEAMNQRASVIFFAILFNGLSSALEILALYVQRPIVEKHARYALYRPLSESVSSIICDLPSKIISTLAFNIPLYFMVHLRRDASAFFIFLLFGFTTTMTMSMILRTIAQSSKTVHQALVPAAIFIIGLVIYAGFVLPIRSMKGWLRWINYVNPIAYAYESLVANEFSGRSFRCQTMIPSGPGYESIEPMQRTCSVAGALPGRDFIDGDFFIGTVYKYQYSHLWRNYGILIAFIIFFTFTYLFAAEYFSSEASKGEILVFRKGQKPQRKEASDEEAVSSDLQPPRASSDDTVHPPTEKPSSSSTFCWRNVCYDVKVKGETRRILSDVNGWVQPGKLTALMGATGAGKTTLLDVLADRVTMGVITGDILVNGLPRGKSFQRTTGYVQQQDIHLETSTVREALRFSAVLRQPTAISMQDKIDYVEEVINLLEMGPYADAVIGVPGKATYPSQTFTDTSQSLFIGLSFQNSPLSLQGLQNQLFSIFMLLVIFAFLTYQTMPGFVTQRTLYEGRERSSKTYAWYNLILANTVIEMAWNSVASLAVYLPFYFLVGMYDNGRITDTQHERGAFMFVLTWAFMLYEGTFSHMCVAGAPTAEVGATLGLFLFMMSLVFCGVLVPYSGLPGFWTFMYRVSPLTYLIGAMISNGVGKQEVTCSKIEFLQFQTPANLTCGEYVGQFVQAVGGALSNPGSNQTCLYCPIASTDTYLGTLSIRYSERWRNFGLLWAFILFDVVAALVAYWLIRVPKKGNGLLFWKK
ncbi:unnamed protein product [Fusarium fujikuroi]|uniref:ABC transporter domain-containing protein n=1 Tax=Fusarium fujikuroi TaxID=5127 RepID=A0A9Q9UFS2_FUSFU|nr:unnamed protein product [Fusarium fujikuroi]